MTSHRPPRLPARIDYQNPNRQYLNPALPQEYPYGYAQVGSPDLLHNSDKGSAKDILRILRKRYWIIIGVTLTSLFLAFMYSVFAPRLYIAKTVLEIRGYDPLIKSIKSEDSLEQDTRKAAYQRTTTAKLKQLGLANESLRRGNLAKDLRNYFNSRKSAFGNFLDYIKTSVSDVDEFAELQDETNLKNSDKIFQFPENHLKNYLGLINVNPLNETSLVQISATTTSPALSQRVANQHADVFIDILRKERQAELSSDLEALDMHAAELKKKLTEAEARLAAYGKEHSLFSLTRSRDSRETNLVVKGLTELTSLLANAKAARINSESKLNQFKQSSQSGRMTDDDKLIQSLRLTLKETEAEYAALASKVTPEYPPLKELGAQVASLKRSLTEEKNLKQQALEAQYQSDLATEAELEAELEKEQSKVNDSSSKLITYNLLSREVESLRELTDSVLKEQMQTQIAAASSKSNIFVSDYAPLPTRPATPKKKLVMGFSLILGLFAGFTLALLVELLNNRIETPEDAEDALGLPVLGSILGFDAFKDQTGEFAEKDGLLNKTKKLLPFFDQSSSISKIKKTNSNSTEGSNNRSHHHGLVSISSPNAAVSEALRSIRASILFSSADAPPKVILLTSANKGEGKTTVCTNLAVTLAQASYKTLLIDADLRNPTCNLKFEMPTNQPGLVDFLTGHVSASEAFVSTDIPGLHALFSGSSSPKPAELVGSRRMSELLDLLRKEFDYILIDSAPVLPVSDTLTLASIVDGIVFVLRSGESERSAGKEAVRRLERVGANILGTVVNDLSLRFSPYEVKNYYPKDSNVLHGEVVKKDPKNKNVVGI